jgi:hypothetical protein
MTLHTASDLQISLFISYPNVALISMDRFVSENFDTSIGALAHP